MRRLRLFLAIFALPSFSVCSLPLPVDRVQPFFKVQFSGEVGWIFGEASYRSLDGGESWKALGGQYRTSDDYDPSIMTKRVQFLNERVGFQGFEEHFKTTDNGGETWMPVGDRRIYDVFFYDESFGFGSGFGSLYRTFDGGHSWTEVKGGTFRDICFFSDAQIFGLLAGNLLKSTDRGETWVVVRQFTEVVWRLRKHEELLWLVGGDGLCISFDPVSEVFRDYRVPVKTLPKTETGQPGLLDIGFIRDLKIVIGGNGTLLISPVGEPSWQRVDLQIRDTLVSLDFSPSGTAFVVGGIQAPVFRMFGTGSKIVLKSENYRNWQRMDLD